MIINKYLNRPINSNIKKRSNRNKSNKEKNKKIKEINIENKNLTLDKILGNNFETINYDNYYEKNDNLKNIEIFNILESENEEESNLNSIYYKTKKIKLPKIPKKIINNNNNNEKNNLTKNINLNNNLPLINWNKFFYSTQFNCNLKKLKQPIKKEKPTIKKFNNKTFKKNKIITIQNFYVKNINLPNIKISKINKNNH